MQLCILLLICYCLQRQEHFASTVRPLFSTPHPAPCDSLKWLPHLGGPPPLPLPLPTRPCSCTFSPSALPHCFNLTHPHMHARTVHHPFLPQTHTSARRAAAPLVRAPSVAPPPPLPPLPALHAPAVACPWLLDYRTRLPPSTPRMCCPWGRAPRTRPAAAVVAACTTWLPRRWTLPLLPLPPWHAPTQVRAPPLWLLADPCRRMRTVACQHRTCAHCHTYA